jgi:predicted RNase H-like HicB family nuclease
MDPVRVIHEQEEDTWVATSPEVANWTVVADSYQEAYRLAEDFVRFALDHDAVEIKHFVRAPAA